MLKNRFGDISALDALELLCWTFNADKAFVSIGGSRMPLSDLYDDTALFTLKASDVDLQFYGGPPPAKWWNGTLLTMLMDHFLFAYSKKDMAKVHKALKV